MVARLLPIGKLETLSLRRYASGWVCDRRPIGLLNRCDAALQTRSQPPLEALNCRRTYSTEPALTKNGRHLLPSYSVVAAIASITRSHQIGKRASILSSISRLSGSYTQMA